MTVLVTLLETTYRTDTITFSGPHRRHDNSRKKTSLLWNNLSCYPDFSFYPELQMAIATNAGSRNAGNFFTDRCNT
jgi:hypothetical protein